MYEDVKNMQRADKTYKNSKENKAYVIAVAGAGGKTGYIRNLSKELSDKGYKVCITTTTHIAKPELSFGQFVSCNSGCIFHGSSETAYWIGKFSEDHPYRLEYPGDEVFMSLINAFDYILVEADGSRHLPAKIPQLYREPVIPLKTDEIVVIMGKHAIGKKMSEVCHRYKLQDRYTEDQIITEEILENIAKDFYVTPLLEKYPGIPVKYIQREKKPAFIVMASGCAKRFGENKLLQEYNGLPLYKHILYELVKAGELLKNNLNFSSEIILVTRFNEIIEDRDICRLADNNKLRICINTEYKEGIAASVRLGAKMAHECNCSEYIYCAADMPLLTADDMYEYVKEYIYSGKHFAVMDDGLCISNPGSISSAYYNETIEIRGDRGGMQVIRKHPAETYHHPIASCKLKDIDTKEDLK